MALYIIASLIQQERDGKNFVRQYMEIIFTGEPDTQEQAYEIFKENFLSSEEAASGWILTGNTKIAELHRGHLEKWYDWISPAPESEVKKPNLRLVKDE